MGKYVNLGCIVCEDRGCVVKTKAGYRCEGCGAIWQSGRKRKRSKPTSAKPAV